MDSFPAPLPNSQLPSGILLTFFWFGPNLLGLVSPSRFQISCGYCHDKNHEPRDIHPEVSVIVLSMPASTSPPRETPSAHTTPSHKILRTVTAEPVGKKLKEGQASHQITATEAFGRGCSYSRGLLTLAWPLRQTHHVIRVMGMPARWIAV